MDESAQSSNNLNSNLVSRNAPVALVVGASGFIGSHLAENLLDKGIQVIGIDDFSFGEKINLENLNKNKKFHFINSSIASSEFKTVEERILESTPRLDYAFFAAESPHLQELYTRGIHNFLSLVINFKKGDEDEKKGQTNAPLGQDKPRIVFLSSISLYDNDLDTPSEYLKEGEIRFAKMVRGNKLNGRIVRLSEVFGPRMHFREKSPIVRLISSALNDNLNSEHTSLDFSCRALFISDAIHLIIKSLMSGSTADKIFDGALFQPIKVSEVKQVLLDPLWHENKNFKPTELPPWPTPNLEKTMKELAWKPKANIVEALKETLVYFQKSDIVVPKENEETKEEWKKDLKKWSFAYMQSQDEEARSTQQEAGDKDTGPDFANATTDKGESEKKSRFKNIHFKKHFKYTLIASLIILGLLAPIIQLIIGGLTIRANLKSSAQAISKGDFPQAKRKIAFAQKTLNDTSQIIDSLALFKRIGLFSDQIDDIDQMTKLVDEGVKAASYAADGTESLFKTTKIISGESTESPKEYYKKAQLDLTIASQKAAFVKAQLSDQNFLDKYPKFIKDRAQDLSIKLDIYSNLVEKAKAASFILPEITAVEGKKAYLLLIQNNLELRPGGGFIGSYGRLNFEKGKLVNILVDDVYNLDGQLKEVITPPQELTNDLGINRLYLRDSNYEPDFPTSARTTQTFYRKEAGENVNGVIGLDLTGSGMLLNAVGGLDLPDYGEHVDGNNLFERVISHAEVGFFPGSQAKKNYLTSLQSQLFNKIFYLSNQNWPGIIQALAQALEQKHLLIYLADPSLFAYAASENWSGVLPRGTQEKPGLTSDFLAVSESNMGANKSNFYLTREFKLESKIEKEGQISHKLKINYKNNSPSDVFPGGKYKMRFKIYLPLGAKLQKALFGETDVTKSFTPFTDYDRSGFTNLLIINPKEQKSLILEYILDKPLNFKDEHASYRLDVIKQPGTDKDRFDFQLTYPINFELTNVESEAQTSKQEVNISTDLLKDRSFLMEFNKQ